MEWIDRIPSEPGRYWAWCKYDGDMMPVNVECHDDHTVVRNDGGTAIIVVGDFYPKLKWDIVFSHFIPYTEDRPHPPYDTRNQP